MPETMRIARIAPHLWEEPPISGEKGTGAVFFSGCTLRCVYCQNADISHRGLGRPFTPEQLTLAMFSEGEMYSVINMPGSLVQEWMGAERFVKDESSLSYRDAACLQPVDQMGLRLTGTDDGGNELTFAVLVDLAQEPEQ